MRSPPQGNNRTSVSRGDSNTTTRVLRVPISTVNMREAVETILGWIRDRQPNYVCVRDVHGIMLAQRDNDFLSIHEGAGLITPDGMPLVWISRSRGHSNVGRVCGADLVDAMCAASLELGHRHFFYGGKPGVANEMARRLSEKYPGLSIAGCYCPPFGENTPEEDQNVTNIISKTSPDIVWIGLSTPKQEVWMRTHVGKIPGATLIGVGAAFDFHSGTVKRAPRILHNIGLEWAYRLASEPQRLWRRYLVLVPQFVIAFLRAEIAPEK